MGGRSVRRRGPLPPQLPRLLLLMSLVLASASVEAGWSRIPASFLERIKSRELTLPPEVHKFDIISAGGSLYPDEIRKVSLKGVSLCACRHRCLTDLSCMGFEHQKEGGTCGLTDVLLPAPITPPNTDGQSQSPAGGWSTGRRRGISWLGAPCHTSSDCSLLVQGSECGPEGFCACQSGWTPLDETLCRPEEHWVPLPDTDLPGTRLLDSSSGSDSLNSCQDRCKNNIDCWTIRYDQTTKSCQLFDTTSQTVETNLPTASTAYQIRLGRWTGNAPSGYTDVGGRLFMVTSKVASKEAPQKCLNHTGVQYVPDSEKLAKKIQYVLSIRDDHVGLGFNDALKEGRFETADGSVLSFPWAGGQPDDAGYGEDCGGFFAGGWKLNDLPCSSMSVKQLCEYIGPTIQPSDISRTVNETVEGKTITWLTYDLREQQTVSRILYIAPDRATTPTEVVQIRVGELPDDVSDLHSSHCVHQTSRLVAAGFGRRFACAAPLVGRYLHVAQSPAISAPLAPTVAVFGMLQGSMTGV
ncbi:Hemolymph lipopolysaccharide-binding protein [Amphibalanus amphitrite]|uniref:Hemolymph lipopolysaccharide-binding protein n=1 Tax=Amphibalanus amphitrite TaxID=1232801 RepID=A0A6A4V8D1_AMPAM|nr:Hemolymph lipopolysaccharide-binding protein [Amphibalanus amphitrite]